MGEQRLERSPLEAESGPSREGRRMGGRSVSSLYALESESEGTYEWKAGTRFP